MEVAGGVEARAEGAAPDAAALHIEVDQEPSAVLWAKVAAMWALFLSWRIDVTNMLRSEHEGHHEHLHEHTT